MCKSFANYHTTVYQLKINVDPTKHPRCILKLNQRRLRHATRHYNLGNYSVWEYLLHASNASVPYDVGHRLWAIRNSVNDSNESDDDFDDNLDEDGDSAENPTPDSSQLRMAGRCGAPGSVCIVCMTATTVNSQEHFIIFPCFHGWICGNCVDVLNDNEKSGPEILCPMCREKNVTFQRMYFG